MASILFFIKIQHTNWGKNKYNFWIRDGIVDFIFDKLTSGNFTFSNQIVLKIHLIKKSLAKMRKQKGQRKQSIGQIIIFINTINA